LFFVVSLLSIVISLICPAPMTADQYDQLEEQLKSPQPIDTQLLESLPDPSSPGQYHLRAKARERFSDALDDLDRAVTLSDAASDTLVRDWIQLALLAEPSSDRLDRLKSRLKKSPSEYGEEIWLMSGKYAAYHDDYSRAIRWTNRAVESPATRSEALLDRAYYQLEKGRIGPARDTLHRFLLEDSNSFRPRYWNLRGQVSGEAGNNSEAYVAHNQVVRNYPDSLEIAEAERRLADLPLPDPFRLSKNSSVPMSVAKVSGGESEEKTTDTSPDRGDWKIQLGSFQERERAQSFKRRMESRLDQNMRITPASVDGRRYFRVQITGFPSRDEASRRSNELESQGIDSFVMK
jgi:tetratricopeptide (TPR) repeat protein